MQAKPNIGVNFSWTHTQNLKHVLLEEITFIISAHSDFDE